MPLPLAIPVALAAVQTAHSIWSSISGANAQRAANREEARRMEARNQQILGEARAVGAADEFGLSGSLPAYIGAMATEMRREVQWTRRAGAAAAGMGQNAGIFSALADFGGSLIRTGEANKWWQGGGGDSAASSVPYYLQRP